MKLIDIITNPGEVLLKAKQEKSMGHSIVVALLASVIVAFGVFLIWARLMQIAGAFASKNTYTAITGIAVISFVLVIVFEILSGLFVRFVMRTLGGSGGFFEGLTVTAYSCFVSSIALLTLAVFSLIPGSGLIGLICLIIGVIIAMFLFGISLATLYRGLKEMFETDMITAFIGVSIIGTIMYAGLILGSIAIVGSLATTMGGGTPFTGMFSLLG